MADARAFPLEWPPHRARTRERKYGKFKSQGADGWMAAVTVSQAYKRAIAEVERLGGQYPVLSSNLPQNRDGSPRSDSRPVDGEVGVCLYFGLKGQPIALACDTYTDVAQNIAAVAAHLEATRAIERHGVATAAEALQAFAALPPPPDVKPKLPWWEVLGVVRDRVDADEVRAMFKVKAMKAHPDRGGTADAMSDLNVALEEALKELA